MLKQFLLALCLSASVQAQIICLPMMSDGIMPPVIQVGSFGPPAYPFVFDVSGTWTPHTTGNGKCSPPEDCSFEFSISVTVKTAGVPIGDFEICLAPPQMPPTACWPLPSTPLQAPDTGATFSVNNLVIFQSCGSQADWIIQLPMPEMQPPAPLARWNLSCSGC